MPSVFRRHAIDDDVHMLMGRIVVCDDQGLAVFGPKGFQRLLGRLQHVIGDLGFCSGCQLSVR